MASLREIKSRIGSVRSTEKITSAMKMVSSAKLRKAEKMIQSIKPYESKLAQIMHDFLHSKEEEINSAYSAKRSVNKVAIVAFSSNSSLCGAFNSNVYKGVLKAKASYVNLGDADFDFYTVGKKVTQALIKQGIQPVRSYDELAENPSFDAVRELTDHLTQRFLEGKIDRVKFVFHEYISKGKQELQVHQLLPLAVEDDGERTNDMFLLEPNQSAIYEELIPKVLRVKMYRALLDSQASEHAARMMAMQSATDNARELLDTLTLQYNKTRQQAITAELLDILGGSL